MKNLRRAAAGLVATVATVAFASLAVLAPASPAAAADAECSLSPASVVLHDQPKTVKFGVQSGFPYWAADLNRDDRFDIDDENRSLSFSAKTLYPSDAGKRIATVALLGDEGEPSLCETPFTLLRGSALSLTVKKAGAKRQVSGTLKQITFGQAKPWTAVKGQKVAVQYRATSGRWVTTATVKTQAGGKFKVTKKLGKRPWRVVYAGNATAGACTSKTVVR